MPMHDMDVRWEYRLRRGLPATSRVSCGLLRRFHRLFDSPVAPLAGGRVEIDRILGTLLRPVFVGATVFRASIASGIREMVLECHKTSVCCVVHAE